MRYLEEDVLRIGCKGKKGEGHHEYGSRIDTIGDIVINGVELYKE